MRLRWILCAQLWACSALAIEPGQGFGVNITWPAFVQQVENLEPVSLQYQVDACERFTAEVRVGEAGRPPEGWQSVPVEVAPAGGRAFRSTVDATRLIPRLAGACYAVAEKPLALELQLRVTCTDGRVASSSRVPMHFATGEAVAFVGFTSAQLHPLDSNRLLFASPREIGMLHLDRTLSPDTPIKLARHQAVALGGTAASLAHNATHAYVASTCGFPQCVLRTVEDPQTHEQLSVPNSEVLVVDWTRWQGDPNDRKLVETVLQVPGSYLTLQAQADGSILAVGGTEVELDNIDARAPGFVISRIVGHTVHTEAVIAEVYLHDISPSGTMITERGEASEVRLYNLDDGSLRGHYKETIPAMSVGNMGLHARVAPISGDRLVFFNMTHLVVLDRMGHKLGGTLFPPGCGGATSLSEVGNKLVWASFEETPQMLFTYDLGLL